MKYKKILTTTFSKLIISFTITVIVSTASLGIIFYYYFTHNFNSKVEQVNLKMLEHLSAMIDEKIYETLDKVYAQITIFDGDEISGLFDTNISKNASKIYTAHMRLKDIVEANSNLIDSICLYFKGSDLFILYPGGVRYHNNVSSITNVKMLNIINSFIKSNDKMIWSETYEYKDFPYFMQNDKRVCTSVFSYPINLPANEGKGCIVINIKEEAIHNIIKQSYPTTAGFMFITDMNGNIISNSNNEKDFSSLINDDLLTRIIESKNNYSNFLSKVNGIQSIVSYKTLQKGNWRLVNVTSVDQFYEETAIISRAIFSACIIVLIIGLILANVFSVKLYNPVKLIVKNVQNIIKDPQKKLEDKINEYELINNIINEFYNKLNHLENTLQVNRPVLKHNIISELFDNKFENYNEFINRLSLIGINSSLPYYTPLILELDKDVLDNLNTKNNQFIKYNIIEYIESLSSKDFICLAALTGSYRISILLIHKKIDSQKLADFTNKIIDYTSQKFKVSSIIYMDESTGSFNDLCMIIKTVKNLLKYSYFLPDNYIINRHMVEKRICSETDVPKVYIEYFKKALNSGEVDMVVQSIESVVSEIKHGIHSAESCKRFLKQVILSVIDYVKEQKIEKYKNKEQCLIDELASTKNIHDFKEKLFQICYELIKICNENSVNKTKMLIDATCQYIENNLDAPLSLEMVSEIFSVNASYLSKAFKDEKDETFTSYVNRLRLEKARELILSSDMKIEDIALKVGFNSTNYFIKKFKEMYGTTPGLYKLNVIC